MRHPSACEHVLVLAGKVLSRSLERGAGAHTLDLQGPDAIVP